MKLNITSAAQRAMEARAIQRVLTTNRTIDWVLYEDPKWHSNPQSTDILYGVFRAYFSLSGTLAPWLKRPLRERDQDLHSLLLVGAYLLTKTDTASHAAVNETVSACNLLGKGWARNLVNAVLRNVARNHHKQPLKPGIGKHSATPEQTFDHNQFMVEQISQQYDAGEAILAANNQRAPMWIRINQARIDASRYTEKLSAANIEYQLETNTQAMRLCEPRRADSLPGWSEGEISVQDLGGQLISAIYQQCTPQGAEFLLDACAAPGGKLLHLLSQAKPPRHHLALELSPARARATHSEAQRVGVNLNLQEADATTLDWWDGQPYDLILLDAPCSGTGTLRRHPEIKIKLTSDAVRLHQAKQFQLITTLWQALAPNGHLIYATCSLLEQENDQVIEHLLERQADASTAAITLPYSTPTRQGYQTTPQGGITDGFYYSVLRKDKTADAGKREGQP